MLSILGIGYFHPQTEIDNKFILSIGTDTTEEWIVDKIGVYSRRTVLPLEYIKGSRNENPCDAVAASQETPITLGAKAAQMALARAGIKASDLGMVICNSCFPNQIVPTTAQGIASELGANCKAYDVLTACPAFALHVDYLRRFKEERLPEYVLCVSSSALTQKVNYCDRTDPAIWGDGAAAWVMSTKRVGKLKVLESFFTADPLRCEAVVVDRYGYFHQDGRAVRDFSVRQTVRLIKDIETRYGIDWSKDVFVGHQANATMLRQITENREIPETNHWFNAPRMGNQGGAGAPVVLGEHWDDIKPGQKIVVAVVGAGLSWGSVVMEGC